MGQATLGGYRFDIDPESVAWTYSTKTKVTYTVGGKVVQVFGTRIEDVAVSGSFGQNNFAEQDRLYAAIQEMAGRQSVEPYEPHRFFLPQRQWDFQVYIKSMRNPDGSRSISTRPELSNPKFILTMQIVEDRSGLKKAASDLYIKRLTEGIGWKKSIYNGPIDDNDRVQQGTIAARQAGDTSQSNAVPDNAVDVNDINKRPVQTKENPFGR